MPQIAISGKGGVGKTTLVGLLALIYASQGQKVLAIDADPASNLASALGFPEDLAAQVAPIAEMEDLIAERRVQTRHLRGVLQDEPQGG